MKSETYLFIFSPLVIEREKKNDNQKWKNGKGGGQEERKIKKTSWMMKKKLQN